MSIVGQKRPFESTEEGHGGDSGDSDEKPSLKYKRRQTDLEYQTSRLSNDEIMRICAVLCSCDQQCSKSLLTPQVVKPLIAATYSKGTKERSQYIFGILRSALVMEDGEVGGFDYKVDSQACCKTTWRLAHGFSEHTVRNATQRILQFKPTLYTPTKTNKKKHSKREVRREGLMTAAAWIKRVADTLGDLMPTGGITRIPYSNRLDVYKEYKADMTSRKWKSVSY